MIELSRMHLEQLESQNIFVFREAYRAQKIAMPPLREYGASE
jgi:hypothetical protein